jgi:hypothetical protein
MRNSILFVLLLFAPFGIPSCDDIIKTATSTSGGSTVLSNSEIIEGLKTALRVGTDSSVSLTSRTNGFYKDEIIKIFLPPEADIIYDNKDNALFRATGLDKKIEDAVLAVNRAAEDAAKEAGPIFKDAILSMSISDGMAILRGRNPASGTTTAEFDSTAATEFLKSTTYLQLRDAFAPKINTSLNKKLVGNFSPNELWNGLTGSYNAVANKSFGMVKPMGNTDLGAYVTEKALDGLFYKVALEEIKIRRDPWRWAKTSVGNILQKVFGNRS